jgi:hypothetical protein
MIPWSRLNPFGAPPLDRRSPYRPSLELLEGRTLPAVDVLTGHNDNARTGDNLQETTLTPANVNPTQFGKRFSDPVDGQVYAQPLVVTGVSLPGQGTHDLVIVATEHDSVYAFDANHAGAPLWQTSFINPAAGVTTLSTADVHATAIAPEIGITSTPVIDRAAGTLYVVAMTKEVVGGQAVQVAKLHALDLTTGADKLPPVVIQAKVRGLGRVVRFDPRQELNRAALLLSDGIVYTAWASHDDQPKDHGWVIAYNAANLAPVGAFNTSPDGQLATVWQSGGGLAADAAGRPFLVTGNGTFSANQGGRDFGNSVLRLAFGGGRVSDFFAPFNDVALSKGDVDLGSGGPLLLPDQAGRHPHLLLAAGKAGTVYLIDRDHLGGFSPARDRVVQELRRVLQPEFGVPAFFDAGNGLQLVYYAAVDDQLKAFQLVNGVLSPAAAFVSADVFGYPGATPSVSANGTANGIVWALDQQTSALRAYDATNVGTELYSSSDSGGRDQLDQVVKFTVPTVANGEVFVGTNGTLTVFGELP